jgi:single-strand DNA-binding protein
MSSMNRVFLAGNLTRDPELRRTPSGVAVADLGLAVSDRFKDKSGQVVERTCFVDIVTWNRQAETCGERLRKGAPVLVEGRLQLDQWQTEGGEKRKRLRVCAERVQFLGKGVGEAGGQSQEEVATETPRSSSLGNVDGVQEMPF